MRNVIAKNIKRKVNWAAVFVAQGIGIRLAC